MVGLWYAHINRYSYKRLFPNVVNQLQQLESEQGMQVTVNGNEETVYTILVLFSVDNLGVHSFERGMRSEYDLCVVKSRKSNYDTSKSGIKHGCPLNSTDLVSLH